MSIGSAPSDRPRTVCRLVNKEWLVSGDPFILSRVESVFPLSRRSKEGAYVAIPAGPEQCRDLLWFKQRYPIEVDQERFLRSSAAKYMLRQQQAESILSGNYSPSVVEFARGQSPRPYQQVAADLWRSVHGLLLADEVGMGKTLVSITALTDPNLRPACVVVPVHLAIQWKNQLKRFVPSFSTHIVRTTAPYSLELIADCPACGAVVDTVADTRPLTPSCPVCKTRLPSGIRKRPPDVTIISYSKLLQWPDHINRVCRSVIYDEAHALRSGEKTDRWKAARRISRAMEYRLLMTATPLFNMGGEAFNIIECANPGFLGDKVTFQENWCQYAATSKEPPLRDPEAFGSYLRSQRVMLRRTAVEVGIPVHDCEIIHQTVDADEKVFEDASTRAEELAKHLLEDSNRNRGVDTMEFDSVLRQATGLAKVDAVVAFTEMLLEQDESVVLFAWHRAVHQILYERLKAWSPVMYTGSENAEQKAAAVHRFQTRDSKVILVSLRAGEGLDGLQFASCTAVIAELDWTWSVAKQNIGRIARDGQTRPCRAYFLVSEYGSDPVVSQVLGLKKDQLNGLIGDRPSGPVKAFDSSAAIKSLAEKYLRQKRRA